MAEVFSQKEIDDLLAAINTEDTSEKLPGYPIKPDMTIFFSMDRLSIQKILREVNRQIVAKALITIDAAIKDIIFDNMSKNAVRMLKKDIEYLWPMRLKDVEDAQREILRIIKHMELTGELVTDHIFGTTIYMPPSTGEYKNLAKKNTGGVKMSKNDFEKEYFEIFNQIIQFANKARREGILSLEEDIDKEKFNQREIVDFGIQLICDGMNYKVIDNILTNIINLESENDKKILMTIKKEGVLGIQQGLNPRELSLLLNSHVGFGIAEAIRNYTK
jgi:hypothetical protein